MWTVPTGLSEADVFDVERIGTTLIARVTYDAVTGGARNTFNYYAWNHRTNAWTTINGLDAGSNLTFWSIGLDDDNIPTGNNIADYIKNGSMFLSITPGTSNPPEAGVNVTFSIQYFEASTQLAGAKRARIERGQERSPKVLAVRRTIVQSSNPRSGFSGLLGIFSKSIPPLGDDLLRGRREKRVPNLWTTYYEDGEPQGYYNVIPRIETSLVKIDSNRITIRSPDTWNKLRERWGLAASTPLYVQYYPASYEGVDIPNHIDGWTLERATDGTSIDKLHWNINSDSGEETLQHKPPYGTTYTVSYEDFADASVYARLTISNGLDKNPDKTLTIHFHDVLSTASGGGGDPGGGGGGGGRYIIL